MDGCVHVFLDDLENGVSVCSACGVTKTIFSSEAEWRDPARERCDTAAWHASDASDSNIDGTAIAANSLLSKMNRSLARYNKTLQEDKTKIEEVCHYLHLSNSVCVRSIEMMCDVRKNCDGVWRGNRRVALRAACISLACKNMNVGINDTEIMTHPTVNIPVKCLNKQKKTILMFQHARKQNAYQADDKYTEFGRRFCSQLGFDYKLTNAICARAEALSRKPRLQSKQSNMILAVTVMHVLRSSPFVSVEQLCQATSVTAPTLAKWYAEAFRVSYSDARDMIRQMQR